MINTKPYLISIKLFILALILVSASSCVSYKNIPYFQDLNTSHVTTVDISNYTPNTIQPQDELLIDINSLNPEASAIFNNSIQNSRSNSLPVYEYLVNQQGDIILPLIGEMKVSGLTTEEVSDQLRQRLLKYLKEAKVAVRIINFKVAVLGDVARPNVYNSTTERLTVTEALSLAGDLNVTADRKSVLLVREENGKRQFYPIDLTSKNIFDSPYFYLRSNDLLYVQPGKHKVSTIEPSGYRNASLIISALSVFATLAILLFRNN
jgi:polysaccharide export outer membrane protein